MMRPRHVLLAAVLLASCGSDRTAEAGGGNASDSAAVASTPPDTAQAAAADSRAAPGGPAVVLAPDGLEVGGSKLAFGQPQPRVLSAAGAALGAAKNEGRQEECPAGPLHQTTFDGVQLVFQDSAFVGWAAQSGSPLRTSAGIGPGSTQAQIKAAYPAATVDETSLGTEFIAGDLYGVFADSTASAPLEIMFAGINCIFR
jgi:hypothetical protein